MIRCSRVVPIAVVVAASLLVAPGVWAQAGSLTTGYVWDSGWCAGPFLDLTVTATTPLTITGFDMYFKGTAPRDVSVYYKAGTYVGSESTPGAWTLLGTVHLTPGGDGTATPVNLGGVSIPAGETYGFHVWDNLGTGGDSGLILHADPPTYSNADLTLTSNNYTCDSAFGAPSSGFAWEGTVYYQVGAAAVPIPALGSKALIGLAALTLLAGWSALYRRFTV